MNLTFRQLRAFREVMRSGSISEAARTLGRTQPSVTSMIANLEAELGFDLFLRQRGRLVAKPEAHYFFEEANHVLDRLAQSARTMRQIGDLERGQLRIACLPAASGFWMPRLVSEFVKTRPHVSVSLMMRSSKIVEELVASQQYDIGLAETPERRGTLFLREFKQDCVCAMHKDDPAAARETVTPNDLTALPMAALYKDHVTFTETRNAFDSAEVVFNQRFELQTFLPALELVEQRLCYTVCDPITAASYPIYRSDNPVLVFRKFLPAVSSSISILTPAHRPSSEIAEEFSGVLASRLAPLN